MVVACDVAIVLSLLVSFQILAHYEKKENREYDEQTLTTDDFALAIRNLPPFKRYHSLQELKSSLWLHFEKVLGTDGQIVNIHFARADVKKLKILLKVKKLETEIGRENARFHL